MAVHDWTRVLPGTFRDFRGRWITHLSESLNAGLLPAGYYALSEQAEPIQIGALLPDMPLFIAPGWYINVPLEATYLAAWRGVPERWRRVIEGRSSSA